MDKYRSAGTARQARGVRREAAGTACGDAKLAVECRRYQVEGMIQNFIGCVNDAVKSMPRGPNPARKDGLHAAAGLAQYPQTRLKQS
jgi:uncharacterized protein YjbJ (UPF0337 family)